MSWSVLSTVLKDKGNSQQSRSPAETPLGRAACWVDDNFASAVELSGVSDVQEPTPTYVFLPFSWILLALILNSGRAD